MFSTEDTETGSAAAAPTTQKRCIYYKDSLLLGTNPLALIFTNPCIYLFFIILSIYLVLRILGNPPGIFVALSNYHWYFGVYFLYLLVFCMV